MRELPIGVFDSGIGGLTVLRGLMSELPHERFVYFGDTARVPYGTKSHDVVLRYSKEIAHYLLGPNPKKPAVKMIVIACNTASAHAGAALANELPAPVIGVVKAGAQAAARLAPKGTIAVIGTKSTIASSVYAKEIKKIAPRATVLGQACSLFVSLVEEGWLNHPVTDQTARIYLSGLARKKPDVLVLGCTHYPMLEPAIAKLFKRTTPIVDSPTAVAFNVQEKLMEMNLAAAGKTRGAKVRFFVSDDPEGFRRAARLFLGGPLPGPVRLVRF
ncbi:MAG: glutamate racemase [Elusimicrobia bacterium]|nr:glutamate racemase [Elusimicrobiota bacterium]